MMLSVLKILPGYVAQLSNQPLTTITTTHISLWIVLVVRIMHTLTIFYISNSINKMKQNQLMNRSRLEPSPPPHNNTSRKQLASSHFFNARLEESKQWDEEKPIGVQVTLSSRHKKINHNPILSADRSMLRVSRRSSPLKRERKVILISEEYYNFGITSKTFAFLENMQQVIIRCQQQISQKREQILKDTIHSIQSEWGTIKQQLVKIVSQWCDDYQKREITHFIDRGEMIKAGYFPQLASKLLQKRQEIQKHLIKMNAITNEQQILKGPQLTQNLHNLKTYFKEIWHSDYEFAIQDLEREVDIMTHLDYPSTYTSSQTAHCFTNQLCQQIQRALLDHSIFIPPSSQIELNGTRISYSKIKHQKKVQLDQNKIELQYLRLQSEREWQRKVQHLLK